MELGTSKCHSSHRRKQLTTRQAPICSMTLATTSCGVFWAFDLPVACLYQRRVHGCLLGTRDVTLRAINSSTQYAVKVGDLQWVRIPSGQSVVFDPTRPATHASDSIQLTIKPKQADYSLSFNSASPFGKCPRR